MELNYPSASYIIPADEIELDLLSLRRYQYNMYSTSGSANPIPIWSAKRPADEYYEFEVRAERLGKQTECKENQTKQLCHICNIDVPTAFQKEHNISEMHKTFLKIIENTMDRVKSHAIEEKHGLTEKSDEDTYFCEFCCDCVRKDHVNLHDASKKHEMALDYCEKIKSFQSDYVDMAGFFKNIDTEIKDDSKGLQKKKRSRKNAQKKAGLVELHSNKINDETSTNVCEFIDTKNDNFELPMDQIHVDMKVDNTLEKLDEASKIYIEPKVTASKTENIAMYQNNVMVPEIEQNNVAPNIDPKINMKTLLQEGIKLDNASVEIGVTITFNTGHKVLVSMDNFHGLHRSPHGPVQCRLCRVLVECEAEHLTDTTHVQYVQRRVEDHHCIRQLDGWIWSHCMICNEHIENKEVHLATYNHISRLQQAIIAKGMNDSTTSESLTQTTENYCNFCDIAMPVTKLGRKKHRLTADHKNKVLIYSEAKKLNSVANARLVGTNTALITQNTAANSQNTIANSQNTAVSSQKAVNSQNAAVNTQNIAANSQNRDVQVKFYPAVKTSTFKHGNNTTNTNKTEPNNNSVKVNKNNAINVTEKQAICRICKVKITNSDANIKEHLNGKLHKINLSVVNSKENSNKTNVSKENVINSGKIKLETAKEVPTNIFKVGPKVNTENTDKIQTKTTIEHPIEVTDKQAICQICKTEVPNTKSNIEDHIGGKRHSSNLAKTLSENRIVIQNGEYFCEVCRSRVLSVNILKHLNTVGHRNHVECKEFTEIMSNPKTPLEIQAAQNCEETHANKNTHDIKIAKDNMISCFICKVKIQNNDEAKKAHKDTDYHLHNLNKVFASKSETDNEIDVKVNSFMCLLCNTEFKLSKTLAHITKNHSDIADSLLDDNLKTHVYLIRLVENNSYQYKCKYCNYPPCSGKFQALLHMLGEKHLSVFAKVMTIPECQNGDTDRSNINLDSILNIPSTSKFDPNLNTKSATTTLLKALEINEIVKSKTVQNSIQENGKCDAIQSEVDHCYDSKDQDCAVAIDIEYCSHVPKVNVPELSKVNIPDPKHSKTAALQNAVLKEIARDRTTQVMPSYSQNITESNAVTNNIKPTNLNEVTCYLCVSKSQRLQLQRELQEESKIKYDINEVCSNCENFLKRNQIVNTDVDERNNNKVVKPKEENIAIDKTTNETKPTDSVPNDAENEYNNVTMNTSAVDDWFDAEYQASASEDGIKYDILNLPDYFEVTDNPEELICMYCETKVLITDCNNHTNEPMHVQCVENLITKRKVEKGGHYEFLQDTSDPSKFSCFTCDEIFEKTPKHIENHIKLDQHDFCYQKLLEANKILLIDDSTSNNCNCKVCEVFFRDTCLIYHINSSTHKTNLQKNTSYAYESRLVDEKVSAAVMFKKEADIIFTHNQMEYYCEFCDILIAADSLTEHIIIEGHFEKFKNILSSHQIEIVSEKYYCKGCRKYLDEKLFNHLSTISHKLNNNNITYIRIGTKTKHTEIPNKSTESNEKEGNPKPKEVTPKIMKTCESIFSMKNARLFCNVCKLEFNAVLDETNRHLNSKSHILLLEVMLSANGIEDRSDDYFCLLCKMDIPAQLVMQHIEMYEHHKITLIDMLHARGKYIFSAKTFTMRINNLVDEKIPEKIISHMRNVATKTYT